jgi:hypothetical protein
MVEIIDASVKRERVLATGGGGCASSCRVAGDRARGAIAL